MKIKINPKKELFKWGPNEFKLTYGSFFVETILLKVNKYYPWPWPTNLCIFQDGNMTWITSEQETRRNGAKYFKRYFLNQKNYKKQWRLWENWIKRYEKLVRGYSKIDFSKLSSEELTNLFDEFYKLNADFWLVVHVPEIANWGGEYLLSEKLKKIDKEKSNEYLEILSAPVKLSFFQEEELALLRVASRLSSRGAKRRSNLKRMLKKHTQKYFWLLNSYGGNRVLDTKYFEKKLKELLKEGSAKHHIGRIKKQIQFNKKRKKQLAKKLKLSKEIILMTDQLSQSIWWQDLRKGYIWQMQYFLDKILRRVAQKSGWKFDDLLWCWPKETLKILQGKKVDKKKIVSRSKKYALYTKAGDKMKEFYGQQVKKLAKIYLATPGKGIKELKGLAVSRGNAEKVVGKVKIVKSPFKDGSKMKKGDILVATMTSPEFIVVMRKAKAIITDHGGMTSHAAIVSREMGKLCVVNTKFATQVLKDGDLVEIDARSGVIGVLK